MPRRIVWRAERDEQYVPICPVGHAHDLSIIDP